MKHVKQLVSILLSTLLALSGMSLAFAQGTACQVGDTLAFGTYPQTRVAETDALKTAADEADNAGNSGFIFDFSRAEKEDEPERNQRVEITDFFCDAQKYRRVRFTQFRPQITNRPADAYYSVQDENGFETDTYYYFRYEPLQWRVLDAETGLVMCETIIDSQPYQNVFHTITTSYPQTKIESFQGKYSSVLANDYATSSIRDWLNYDFYETAFSDAQKALIQTTALTNEAFDTRYAQFDSATTIDKIFLLSYDQALNTAYGFGTSINSVVPDAAKTASGTDYAKCRGLSVTEEGTSFWLLRSAGLRPDCACSVDYTGVTSAGATVGKTDNGIRPACVLTSLTQNAELSASLFSSKCKTLVNLTTERGGHVSPVSGLVSALGAPVTARAYPDEIYLFDGWYDGDTKVSGNEEYTFTATEDMTLTAKYIAPKTIKVYLNGPIGGATVTGNTAARCNDTVSLTVEVNDGYHFIGWYKDEEKVSDNMTYTFTVTEDVVLVATFEKDAAAEEPTDPASPDHPNQDDGGNNTGNMNFFQKLIQMILNFFRRLFSR